MASDRPEMTPNTPASQPFHYLLAELIVQNARQASRIQRHRRIITRLIAERRAAKEAANGTR